MYEIVATTPLTDGISNLLQAMGYYLGWGLIEVLPGAAFIGLCAVAWQTCSPLLASLWRKARGYFRDGAMGAATEELRSLERQSQAINVAVQKFANQIKNTDTASHIGQLKIKDVQKIREQAEKVLKASEETLEEFYQTQVAYAATFAKTFLGTFAMSGASKDSDYIATFNKYVETTASETRSQAPSYSLGRPYGNRNDSPGSAANSEVVQDTEHEVIKKWKLEQIKDGKSYLYWYPHRNQTLIDGKNNSVDAETLRTLIDTAKPGELPDFTQKPSNPPSSSRSTYSA